ncbi:MAG: IS110 family transposase [Actinobacteria bacterium]|nr:MAG: IS110 family transposase [Actinomycetota bacterium]
MKQRMHAVLLTHGKPCPVSDLFGVRGRQLLARLGLPEPWQATLEASLRLIDELEREITGCERELRRLGADQRYLPRLLTVPGIGWLLASTIAAELGDIGRFASPRKLAGYSASARASTNQANATCAARATCLDLMDGASHGRDRFAASSSPNRRRRARGDGVGSDRHSQAGVSGGGAGRRERPARSGAATGHA